MHVRSIILLSCCLLLVDASAASAQGLTEGGFLRLGTAGMGAGLAASLNNGRVVRRSYESMVAAQQAAVAQSKAIAQWTAQAAELEKKKQFANAENAYKYVLSMIARRDGPGSEKSLPVLQKLAKVTKEQKKTDDAIRYQTTVVAFMERAKNPNAEATLNAQNELTNMFLNKQDFAHAEPVAAKAADIVKKNPSISTQQRTATLRVYGSILHQLHKEDAAAEIEKLVTVDTPAIELAAPTAVAPAPAPVTPAAVVPDPVTPTPVAGAAAAVPAVPAPTAVAPAETVVVPAQQTPTPNIPSELVPPPPVPSSDSDLVPQPQVTESAEAAPQQESEPKNDAK